LRKIHCAAAPASEGRANALPKKQVGVAMTEIGNQISNGDRATEDAPKTLSISPQRLVSQTSRQACLVHIYPTGPGMGTRYPLGDTPLVVGRSEGCDIRIVDRSVSRRHAEIQPRANGIYAVDLQSTNGTFVNNKPQEQCKLQDGDYLRVGNCIYRFLDGGNVEAEYHEEIYRLTIIDALTETFNKRYLLEFLTRELARCGRHGRPLALLMFDLDHFKLINDQLGHQGGDFTLRELAADIKKDIRIEDLFARYGGEEFVVVLVECLPDAAAQIAERLRRRVEEYPFEFEGRPFKVTVSIGVASTKGDAPMTAAELIRQADENLYRAKEQGRNRVVI
jgi:diguanylate cyclase (GGDEF)-like protein